jgi:hypothetical protein
MNDAAHDFRRRWWVANSVGFAVGLVLFSLLGHGITGAHDDELTAAQYIAHTVAFLAGSLLVLGAQSRALRSVRKVSGTRIVVGALVSVAVFWFGAEGIRPPFDWILAFTVLGAASWVRLPNQEQGKKVWILAAIGSYWVGICAALALVITWDATLSPDPSSLLDHTTGWLIVGAATGVVGGYLSARALARLLISGVAPSNTDS